MGQTIGETGKVCENEERLRTGYEELLLMMKRNAVSSERPERETNSSAKDKRTSGINNRLMENGERNREAKVEQQSACVVAATVVAGGEKTIRPDVTQDKRMK